MDMPASTARPHGRIARLRHAAGIDFHVFATLLFRGWGILAGGATMLLIPLWLDATQQGYYYTFASVLALQVFFELGLSGVVVQLVSHEVAQLHITPDERFEGPPARLGRLASLATMLLRWYRVAAVLFGLIGGVAGALFFMRRGQLSPQAWLPVWVALIACTAVNLSYVPALSLLEGCGRVGHVARLRLVQSVIGYLALWLVLAAGGGLWAAAVVPFVSAACTTWWLRNRGALFRWLCHHSYEAVHAMSWRTDVLPLQWRIAVSWASGFFVINLFTPVVFAHQGAVEAGRLGMAMAVFNAVTTVGMSWVNAKVPAFTAHIARGEDAALNALFRSVAMRSILVTTALALFVLGVDAVATALGLRMVSRVAPLPVLGWIALATIGNCLIFSAATYMRAHREEPMLAVSVCGGALTALAVTLSASAGLGTMMMLYAAITLFFGLPWTAVLFLRYHRRHSGPALATLL
jgi:hypothetical protein